MRVWVDLTDASSVVFFAPIVRRLEDAGHTVTLTARRFAGADLVLRRYGLGGVLTTAAIREEGAAEALLGAPPEYAMAGLLALGYPAGKRATKLRRNPVEDFTTVDSLTGPAFTPSGSGD